MANDARKQHWESVYDTREPTEVSWYQAAAARSLELVSATGEPRTAAIFDVGGGASTLVDDLLASVYTDVTVLDLAANALDRSRARLGENATRVEWLETDVTRFRPQREYAIWHDRAGFHFLTGEGERVRYLEVLREACVHEATSSWPPSDRKDPGAAAGSTSGAMPLTTCRPCSVRVSSCAGTCSRSIALLRGSPNSSCTDGGRRRAESSGRRLEQRLPASNHCARERREVTGCGDGDCEKESRSGGRRQGGVLGAEAGGERGHPGPPEDEGRHLGRLGPLAVLSAQA
ncbi:MAG TPA: class I SAM-dependent methyltransferase [Thermoanaerobaculia bacterium]|nr:class I SAM-dependent methyltransferase [Thermoanaerobaculia bacterium]